MHRLSSCAVARVYKARDFGSATLTSEFARFKMADRVKHTTYAETI